jgi:hypothetical protein
MGSDKEINSLPNDVKKTGQKLLKELQFELKAVKLGTRRR